MAIIFKNNRWIDSMTGLEVTSPMNSRTDSGLTSEFKQSMQANDYSKLLGLKDSNTNAYNETGYQPPKMDMSRFTNEGMNRGGKGNASNWWEGEAKKLGYGKEGGAFGNMFSSENITNFGTLAKAGSDIANAYSAFQTNKILKAEMEANNANSRANYTMGATNYNDQAEMRNQWLAAQGRDPLYQKAKTTY